MRYGRNKTKTMVALKIAFVWIISIVICSPLCIMGYMDYSNVYNNNYCIPAIREFVLYGSIFAFFIPLGIIVVTKTLTIRILCSNQQLMTNFVQGQTRPARFRQEHLSQMGNTCLSHETNPSLVGTSLNESTLSASSDSNSDNQKSGAVSEGKDVPIAQVREGQGGEKNSVQQEDSLSVKSCQIHCIAEGALAFSITSDRAQRKCNTNMAETSIIDRHEKSAGHVSAWKMFLHQKQKINRVCLADRDEKCISDRTVSNERKATKVLGIIFTVFVALWTPFFIVNILPAVCLPCVVDVTPPVMAVITWLAYLSSFTNPIIYTMFNVDFRRAFHRILTCGYRRQITETIAACRV